MKLTLDDLTVEKVKEAYEKAGEKPSRFWCCPLRVLAKQVDKDGSRTLGEIFGLTDAEFFSFASGFDDRDYAGHPRLSAWYQRGREIAAAIFGEEPSHV